VSSSTQPSTRLGSLIVLSKCCPRLPVVLARQAGGANRLKDVGQTSSTVQSLSSVTQFSSALAIQLCSSCPAHVAETILTRDVNELCTHVRPKHLIHDAGWFAEALLFDYRSCTPPKKMLVTGTSRLEKN
jgi:hypothetical protein